MSDETKLRIVRGNPTDEELAALTVAILSLAGAAPEAHKPKSRWATPSHRHTLHSGVDSWRKSALPR